MGMPWPWHVPGLTSCPTGRNGLRRVSEAAVLNANWLLSRLRGTYEVPFDRPAMHEIVVSPGDAHGGGHDGGEPLPLRAVDVGKRLLEKGFHAPTVYFPLVVHEALMIEPTETESPEPSRLWRRHCSSRERRGGVGNCSAPHHPG